MMENMQKTFAIILAAGSGSRMSADKTKQKMLICGKTVLQRTLEAFEGASSVDGIILVCREGEETFAKDCAAQVSKVEKIVVGGKTRAESAKRGFEVLGDDFDGLILIHDAARCLIDIEDIELVAKKAFECGAATASYPVTDTIKVVDNNGAIIATQDRSSLMSVQTPQAFKADLYRMALANNPVLDASVTDDCALMESIGVNPVCVTTSKNNIKITTPEDILGAELIIRTRGMA